ncbi:hypothetical protein F5X99DRAFT_386544 [Biscogniauxia marginata]|nr:hypothetical protein F5X99DRAFT_386544 [Biscogniauxia marginata]
MLVLAKLTLILVHGGHLEKSVSADAVSDLWDQGKSALDAQLAKLTTYTQNKLLVRQEWRIFRNYFC